MEALVRVSLMRVIERTPLCYELTSLVAPLDLEPDVCLDHHAPAFRPRPQLIDFLKLGGIAAVLILLPVRIDRCESQNGKVCIPPLFPDALPLGVDERLR